MRGKVLYALYTSNIKGILIFSKKYAKKNIEFF